MIRRGVGERALGAERQIPGRGALEERTQPVGAPGRIRKAPGRVTVQRIKEVRSRDPVFERLRRLAVERLPSDDRAVVAAFLLMSHAKRIVGRVAQEAAPGVVERDGEEAARNQDPGALAQRGAAGGGGEKLEGAEAGPEKGSPG